MVKDGYIVREWGPSEKVDMTFSVSKTFLSTTVGLLYDAGLIASVDDLAGPYMPDDELFGSEHNDSITWDHLLRQTSDWQGTLFDKPDWADRPVGDHPFEYPDRPMYEPGTHYKYNDVRVNLLALAALHVVRDPLPVVLREGIMEPIGASNRWRWHGYENSWVMIDGPQRPVGQRRRPLGRRHAHQRPRSRPFRLPVPADGELEGQTAHLGGVDRDGPHSG